MENQPYLTKQQRRELEKEKKSSDDTRNFSWRSFFIWGSALVVLCLVGGWMLLSFINNGKSSIPVPLVGSVSASDHGYGNKDAKVIVVEYSDFQCPACTSYYPLVRQIKEDFKDKIYFVYRQFPLTAVHPNADIAARASEAAALQGKFWEMHNILFEHHDEWATLPDPREKFIGYAKNIGIDADAFSKAIDSSEVKAKVNADYRSGENSHIQGTPTIFINGKSVDNPRSYDEFKQAIQEALDANK